jgi:hypothetical protein
MIGAMARAGALLREPRYTAAAERAAGFVLEDPAGRGLGDAAPHLARGAGERSRRSSTTTRSWSRACSSCTARPETQRWLDEA